MALEVFKMAGGHKHAMVLGLAVRSHYKIMVHQAVGFFWLHARRRSGEPVVGTGLVLPINRAALKASAFDNGAID